MNEKVGSLSVLLHCDSCGKQKLSFFVNYYDMCTYDMY